MAVELNSGIASNRSVHPINPLGRVIIRRILLGLLTLWIVSILVFIGTRLLPGDAVHAMLGRYAEDPARAQALREQLRLDVSPTQQYWAWMLDLVHGNLGVSFASGEPVSAELGQRAKDTGFLIAASALIAIPLSILLGAWSALRRGRLVDHAVSAVTLVLAAVPDFVIGLCLILLFATTAVHAFPAVSLLPPGVNAWERIDFVVLPIATLVLVSMPYITRVTRSAVIDALESEYIEMAHLRGLVRWRVLAHAVRNSLVPAIQVSALTVAWMAGGVVLVESVFSFPGIGLDLVDALGNRDIPVIQAITLVIAALYVVVNLATDVLTILLTPRLRTEAV